MPRCPRRADAAYYRAWRAAHPEYRARQNRLRNERRRREGRADRTAEYAKRPAGRSRRCPACTTATRCSTRPAQVVGPRLTTLVSLADPLYDDLLSEATLALIEGADPVDAVRRYRAREAAFGRVTCPLFEQAA